jgi:hypothetical protein
MIICATISLSNRVQFNNQVDGHVASLGSLNLT